MAPISGGQILIPNAAVAEVVAYTEPQAAGEVPRWFMGNVPWRGRLLPLIAFESVVANRQPDTTARGRVMVIAGLDGHDQLPFYGLYCSGIPHLVQADRTSVSSVEQGVTSPSVLAQVLVNGELALIPNLELLEKMIVRVRELTAEK
ncbi:MAG: chemotaxis protein CheW [Gammaproteobacteria bacterium]